MCKAGYVRKEGFAQEFGHDDSQCVPEASCPVPKTDTINFVEQTANLPSGVDSNDAATWGPLADKYGIDGLSIVGIDELNASKSLSLFFAMSRYRLPGDNRNGNTYAVVSQVVVETADNTNDPIQSKVDIVEDQMKQYELQQGLQITADTESSFDTVVADLTVTIPNAPDPTQPAPTTCTGSETYDENFSGAFLANFGTGVEIVKVISGRGSDSVPYFDQSYGNDIYHNEGDTVRLGCKKGYSNSIGKAFIGATCTCSAGYCGFKRAREDFKCIDPQKAPMPIWQGGVFNYITEVKDSYIVLKARAVNYIGEF